MVQLANSGSETPHTGTRFRPGAVAIVLGTRPEIIKLAPVVWHLGDAAQVIHTGQHFAPGVSGGLFAEYGLPEPAVRLAIGGSPRGSQIGAAVHALDRVFRLRRPSAVVVQGDTNSTVAGALAANAHAIPLVHVEAGLRSFDRRMPEEHNRVITDHLGDLLCAPTSISADNMRREGIPSERIVVTGNTVVEAVRSQLPELAERRRVLAELGVQPDHYVLATIHRPENTDNHETLRAILEAFAEIAREGWPVMLPIHPRTVNAVRTAGCTSLLTPLRVLDPMPHRRFLAIAKHAALLISDSGGLQEEVTVLKRPLLVVRRSTERPEAAEFATLVPAPEAIAGTARAQLAATGVRLAAVAAIPSPYGDGAAGQQIARLTLRITKQARTTA
ncbi:non-hydrolyzing UDP-N-acetylglucosamine 2-epimerase [Gandjariella thermophila]|uniref:UDP-N-acetyl glucosamine 2-epimerase n=1 Tax=Gandjariella thermophila TaxID=1931992 RepID=A0A4D4J4S4_9PSEU|nr:UDP-N-acetylglucosamine 2-epimerase (non-hydrolyzing) [Gandjariella thermophila]GDY29748.1 UDP-N-acetyl glucosamine 2-epimerase [Gandjariella thermophila]